MLRQIAIRNAPYSSMSLSNHKCTFLEKASPVSSTDKATPERPKKSKLRRAAAAVYETLLRQAAEEDDDESDSNDETFEGGEINSSDEENVNGVEESSNDGKLVG